MKIFIAILIALATGLLIYNLAILDFGQPLVGDNSIALIGILASLCVILLLTILLISKKIAKKAR